jgi:hypothetical protein
MATEKTDTAQRGSEPRPEASQDAKTEDFTHYVHLADGSVVRHNMESPLGNHLVADDEDPIGGRYIIGIYPR